MNGVVQEGGPRRMPLGRYGREFSGKTYIQRKQEDGDQDHPKNDSYFISIQGFN